MTAAKKRNLIAVEDYLASELTSHIKHEYLGGAVYAMAGAKNRHNRIAANIIVRVGGRLLGKPCMPFASDTKIRVHLPTEIRFYYPDVSIICSLNAEDDLFEDSPAVIFEVLSESTRRIDDGEKKDAYLTIPSLKVYAMVEQDSAAVVVFRRTGRSFVRETFEGLDDVIPLQEIGVKLPLAEIYAAIQFPSEPVDDLSDS
jgi:Uma2 family endonuclease